MRSRDDDATARQYTICNIMRPGLYEELIRLLRCEDKNMTHLFSLIREDTVNSMMFVVKNYNSQTGLSNKLHTKQDLDFVV